ncbi:MAG: hypothetical protein A2908_02215 [Candidatus Staskawiczbacteria bacterium RIFCSPLOWO2_01_FULL_38_12b]|uniref:histidine kinase n=1 Tax=Candidatus Staskawiczbacteria bacterium RIFCSPLOWO2_01_FULL_38_12b TaxID=1802214 RepID=A0A1G2IFF7_9BACT|nr:MAG: hypothetical protein A2908_02215 [Candidatus Staskawiczbacteria bacterium RIFCSPLOWO2_01_FULL_38_12b]
MFDFPNINKKLTERLYEQNLDFAAKNKIFILIQSLYRTSVLALSPEGIAKEVTNIVCKGLNLEFSGLFLFKKDIDSLVPLSFSESVTLSKTLQIINFNFKGVKLSEISKNDFLKKVVYDWVENVTANPLDIWKNSVSVETVEKMKTQSRIRDIVLYPLITGNKILGAMVFGLNIDNVTLNDFEKSSMKNIVEVVTLLLDKAYADKNLQVSYEIEKKGKEQMEQAYKIEKKAKEDVQELDKNKTEFMLITQHHLRTPLSVNAGFLDLLTQGEFGKIPKKINNIILELQESTIKEIKVVNELLDVSSYQLGKEVTELVPGIDIADLLNETLKDLKVQAKNKGIYLKFEKEGSIPKIPADRTKLKLALTNIIDDCVKYTKQGGVTVTLKSENNKMIILVKDTGMGIAKEALPHLFNQTFHRSAEAQKIFAVGKGIGLFLSGKIIEGHHGKVWAESEGQGRGAVFHIELPVV